MYQIDFQHPVHLHFIGIGGISMSGLAEVLMKEGFSISGSDRAPSELTEALQKKGARIDCPQSAENIREDIDAVVFTAAIHPDNPEYAAAVKAGLPMITRADLLGQIMHNYKVSIAVAGTHGKTTTTSMAAQVLMAAKKDPTVSVGGILPSIGGNIRIGDRGFFLAEACEYTNSFLSLHPTVGIILNIEEDHLDFFADLDDIVRSFRKFAEQIAPEGALIINADTPNWQRVAEGLPCRVISYGDSEAADVRATDIRYDNGLATFNCSYRGDAFGSYHLAVPGAHNVSNALAVIAMGIALSIDAEDIASGLADFTGTERRFQYKGSWRGADIVDDYAHHPTEIRTTLASAAARKHASVYCIFQPHTYTRTHALMDEFADVLKDAEHVILAPIYAARETDTLGISSDTLSEEIKKRGGDCISLPAFDAIADHLKRVAKPGDLILTVGAGDVHLIGEQLLEEPED